MTSSHLPCTNLLASTNVGSPTPADNIGARQFSLFWFEPDQCGSPPFNRQSRLAIWDRAQIERKPWISAEHCPESGPRFSKKIMRKQ